MEIIGLILQAAIALAALYGVYLAHKGLRTWREQISGQADYKLAHRILILLAEYKEDFDNFRNNKFGNTPLSKPEDLEFSEEVKEEYLERDRMLHRTALKLSRELPEIEIMWGEEVTELFNLFFDQHTQLCYTMRWWIAYSERGDDSRDPQSFTGIIVESIIGEDEFKNETYEAMDNIKAFLKTKLRPE